MVMSVRRILGILFGVIVVVGVVGFFYFRSERPRLNVLIPDGSGSFTLMDFRQPITIKPPPDGWYHRIFRRHDPMDISFVTKDGRPSIRLATHDSGSIFVRQVEVPIDSYPFLVWEWFIEQAIETELDERTVEGDDHPARLYLRFQDTTGETHAMEIIWGNRHLKKGDWKHLTFFYIIKFPHYTANGGAKNVGRWHKERVSLRDIYAHLWGEPAGVKLIELGLFCDTDESGANSIAYFSEIRVEKKRSVTYAE